MTPTCSKCGQSDRLLVPAGDGTHIHLNPDSCRPSEVNHGEQG